MKSLFYFAAFCLAVGFLLNCTNAQPVQKSDCELSEEDAKKHLGETVFLLDKIALLKDLDSDGANSPALRACAYATEKDKKEIPYLEWFERTFETREQAKEFFETTFKNNPKKKSFDAATYSTENLSGIGDDAILTQEEREERRETLIIVRKGKSTFILKKAVAKDKAILAEEMKSLAKKIADKIAG